MNKLKEEGFLRFAIIAVFFVVGMILVFSGWQQTGAMSGLITMLVGLVLLLTALLVYNKRFEDTK